MGEGRGQGALLSPPPRPNPKKVKLPDFAARQERIFGDQVLPGNIVAEERESCVMNR
jgi:hypothetical protein